jgi:hypothetical protein
MLYALKSKENGCPQISAGEAFGGTSRYQKPFPPTRMVELDKKVKISCTPKIETTFQFAQPPRLNAAPT